MIATDPVDEEITFAFSLRRTAKTVFKREKCHRQVNNKLSK